MVARAVDPGFTLGQQASCGSGREGRLQFIDATGAGDVSYFAARHRNFNVVALLDSTGRVVERRLQQISP